MAEWEKHFERTSRYFSRFEKLNTGIENANMPSDNYIDDAMAFFMFCYHIKDYLKSDQEYTKHSKKEIEEYVTKSLDLSLCGDVCNGIKHLTLSSTKTGDQPKFGGREFIIGISDGPKSSQTLSIKMKIVHNGNTIDAFELAKRAMAAWRAFI